MTHRFLPSVDSDDDQCDRCEVMVSAAALVSFTLPCPAGDCLSAANPERWCVFATPTARCVFCGREGGAGAPPDVPVDDFEPDDLVED